MSSFAEPVPGAATYRSQSMSTICYVTLAIGPEYRRHARRLLADIQHVSPGIPLVVLTDTPRAFGDAIAVQHRPQSVGIYHDKLDCLAACRELGFETWIFLDADCRLLGDVTTARPWHRGITVKNAVPLDRHLDDRDRLSASAFNQRRRKLLEEIAATYDLGLDRALMLNESVLIAHALGERFDDFAREWRAVRDFLELHAINSGEGAAIGLAALRSDIAVHHYDRSYEISPDARDAIDIFKDNFFFRGTELRTEKRGVSERRSQLLNIEQQRRQIARSPKLVKLGRKARSAFGKLMRRWKLQHRYRAGSSQAPRFRDVIQHF